MSFDPIQHLLDEHVVILARFEELQAAVDAVRTDGEDALATQLDTFRAIGEMMATQLHRHARKEDEAFFPAIEAVLGAAQGPTTVMRAEHQQIYAQGALLRDTLYQLNEVEHPQIEANRDRLRELARIGKSGAALADTGAEILHLVHMHFEKEEQVLFPMAREMLSAETMDRIADAMAAIDSEGA